MKRASTGGFTLIEVTIAAGIGMLLVIAIGGLTRASSTSLDYLSRSHRVDRDLRKALSDLSEELKHASMAGIIIDTSDTNHDMVTLQVPDPDQPETLAWGYPDATGTFQLGWEGSYLVENDTLVLRRTNAGGTVQGADRILCRHVDVAVVTADPVKGFAITQNGELISIELRVHETLDDGNEYRRDERTVIHVINP